MNLNIIIPVHPKEDVILCKKNLQYNLNLSRYKFNKVIFILVSNNNDILNNISINSNENISLSYENINSRASAMNYGAQYVINNGVTNFQNILLFLHIDTFLPNNYAELLYLFFSNNNIVKFCYFKLNFDDNNSNMYLVKCIIQFVNKSKGRQEPYGDQGFAMSLNIYNRLKGYENISFLEDVLMYRLFRNIYNGHYNDHLLDGAIITSSRRYKKKDNSVSNISFAANMLNNNIILLLYKFNLVSIENLGRWYYRNDLNSSVYDYYSPIIVFIYLIIILILNIINLFYNFIHFIMNFFPKFNNKNHDLIEFNNTNDNI
jgi:hypothetical protein